MKGTLHSRIPWRVKMEKPDKPRIVQTPPKWEKQQGKGTMLIATPRLVENIMKQVRKGKLLTIKQIRERLSKDFGTTTACPLCTGIFVRIVSEAASEDLADGKTRVAPFWRLVREDGRLMEKFPGGPSIQARMLREEGHRIIPAKGNGPARVKEFELSLTEL